MANFKHVEILTQGVVAWNQWREQNPNIKPNLSGTNLFQAHLAQVNLRQTDLRKADFREAELSRAVFSKSDLRAANLRGADLVAADLRGANMSGAHIISASLHITDLRGADIRSARLDNSDLSEANLENVNLGNAHLPKANLSGALLKKANLRGCNLQDTDLQSADLTSADLSLADVTGTKLKGSERDQWKIDGINCKYAYWDDSGSLRTPADRDFKPGEFELLYRESPTIEYLLDDGFAPFQIMVMNRVVKSINHRLPEFELRLDSLIFKGVPRAVLSVLHRDDRPKALELINKHYLKQLKQADTQEVQQCISDWNRRISA